MKRFSIFLRIERKISDLLTLYFKFVLYSSTSRNKTCFKFRREPRSHTSVSPSSNKVKYLTLIHLSTGNFLLTFWKLDFLI